MGDGGAGGVGHHAESSSYLRRRAGMRKGGGETPNALWDPKLPLGPLPQGAGEGASPFPCPRGDGDGDEDTHRDLSLLAPRSSSDTRDSGLARLPYLWDTAHVGAQTWDPTCARARAKERAQACKRELPGARNRVHGRMQKGRHECANGDLPLRAKGLAQVPPGSHKYHRARTSATGLARACSRSTRAHLCRVTRLM